MDHKKPNNHQDENRAQSDLWLVKLETDQVRGPYSTEAICKMILEGIYSGQEHVASYPQGDWRPISKQTEFYETLLESLENPVERDEKKALKMDAETVIRTAPVAKHLNVDDESIDESTNANFASELQKLLNLSADNSKDIPSEHEHKNEIKNVSDFSLQEKQLKQFNLEQEKIAEIRKNAIKKIIPILCLAILLLSAGIFYYFYDSKPANTAWALVTPNFKKAEVNPENTKALKESAIALIKNGILDDLIKAQNILVESVENKKNDIEALGLLCTVHYSLWPYTKQISNDLRAISAVAQQIRSTSPLSSYSDTCQAIYLLTKGQTNDGRAILEKVLDQNTEQAFLLYPFIYLIKGQLLEELGSLVNAEAYYTEAEKNFPKWVTADFNIARIKYKQSKYPEAAIAFEKLIKKHTQFKAGYYGLALSLNKSSTVALAFENFEKGYSIEQTVPKDLLVESLQDYANLLVDRQENKKALNVVQSALKISPTHRALKDLFISLGGETIAAGDSQVTELIIEGDQFFRLGDFLAAQGRYRAAFDIDKKNTLLAIKIAKSMRALNQINESISWIDRALKIDSKLFSAYSLKADYYIQRFNFVDAEVTLQVAQKIDPTNYEILKGLAKLDWKKNNLNQALLIGEKAYKQYNVDVELLTLLANISIDIFYRPKKIGIDESDSEKVVALENAQKYSARSIDLEPAWPESQITYAKYLNAKDGSQKSEKYYLELIKSFPYTIDYRLALAEFFEQQEKTNSALEIYQHVIESDPKNTKANMGLARCYRMKNDYAAAIRYFMLGAALDPSDVEPMFSIAQLQLEMGQNESNSDKANKLLSESLSRFELVKKSNPNYPKAYYFTAKVKIALGLYNEAYQDINTEKAKNPNLADAYILSADISQKQNQFAQCAKDYMIVIKLRPASEYYFKAGACQRLAGALDLAEELINEGHVKESGNYNYFREMGYLYELKGEKDLARKNFQDYLVLTAHNSVDAKEIESKLSALGN